MNRRVLFAGLFSTVVFLFATASAFADHCNCRGGYSIGGCSTPTVRNYSGITTYSPAVNNSYDYQPQQYQYYVPQTTYYRSYPTYNYSRPRISIHIGSGRHSIYSHRSHSYGYGHSYGFGHNYGHGFSFGSFHFGRHHHH